jgi:Mor family transcriptional regulator
MSYKKADNILPAELLSSIQEYVDGVYIYIPRKENNKKSWGERTGSKEITFQRNLEICQKYKSGISIKQLSQEFFLSPKWIYKIIANFKL